MEIAQNGDIHIPGPLEASPEATLKPGDQIAPGATNSGNVPIVIVESHSIGQTDAIIGGAVLLILLVAFYFLKGTVENNLIANMARPRKAANAGWLLFIMMTAIATSIIFGYLAKLWLLAPVLIAMIVVCVALMLAFAISYVSARRSSAVS